MIKCRRSAHLARVTALSLVLATTAPAAVLATIAILPAPVSVVDTQAAFQVSDSTVVVVPVGDVEAVRVAAYLSDLVQRTRGLTLVTRQGVPTAGERAIVLRRDGPSKEAYVLEVSSDAVVIYARESSGLFYGATTLWQIISEPEGRGPIVLKGVRVEDVPRFAWRGLMLDSARHYQSPDFVKQLIAAMAVEKLNVLHWHLTDDQGWRLEIKKYPKLTEVGAWRVPAGRQDIDPETGKPRVEGGFYTQDQVREIVAYAAARNITVVPEIEMPGHAQAAIVAYPQLGSVPLVPTAISADWGVFPYLYNVDDQTFGFLQDVLTEVMNLFPSQYIHVGGDEAMKDQWKANPAIQAKMKTLGIADEDALQSWFIQRIEKFLNINGRKLVGWDEILEGGVAPNATVMSWRGTEGAIMAAKAGHDTILSPLPELYLDYRQVPPEVSPLGQGNVVSLQSIYAFEPVPTALDPAERKHLLGVQANLWTEFVDDEARAWRMLFPRAAALAEVGWSPDGRRDWSDFARRLAVELRRYRALGIDYDIAALQPLAKGTLKGGNRAEVTMIFPSGIGEIRYTLDGKAPTTTSALYAGPLDLALPTTVRAAAFQAGRALAEPTTRLFDATTLRHRTSHELTLCSQNKNTQISVQDDAQRDGGHGPDDRAMFLIDLMSPCWTYDDADLTGVTSLNVSVGQIPYNFQDGDDLSAVNAGLRRPRTPDGELEIRLDGCDGAPIAIVPLKAAAASMGVTTLSAAIPPRHGTHSLCFTFAQPLVSPDGYHPMWTLDWVQLVPPAEPPN